jgi:hypothetical protein
MFVRYAILTVGGLSKLRWPSGCNANPSAAAATKSLLILKRSSGKGKGLGQMLVGCDAVCDVVTVHVTDINSQMAGPGTCRILYRYMHRDNAALPRTPSEWFLHLRTNSLGIKNCSCFIREKNLHVSANGSPCG